MAKIISFEGGIGAGKSTLVNFFAAELKLEKITEHSHQNPFIDDFYAGENVRLETELVFLLQHYSLLKNARTKDGLILADFSIEKDIVFARLNLNQREFELFKQVYNFAIGSVGTQDMVIYLDLSPKFLTERIKRRGRVNENTSDPSYFRDYSSRLKAYFMKETKSRVIFINSNYEPSSNKPSEDKLHQIRQLIDMET